MILFILGIICGFALAVLIMTIYAVVKAASITSREEEQWHEDRGLPSDSKGH